MSIQIKQAKVDDIKAIIKIQKNDGFKHAYYLTNERLQTLFRRGEFFYSLTKGVIL